MKTIKYTIGLLIFLISFAGCEEEDNFDYLDEVTAPTDVAAVYDITQDNTGLVTITPNSNGATTYNIYLGDGTTAPVKVKQSESISHTYAEGTYSVKIEALGITGLKTEVTQELVVSFKAPENLEVIIENDPGISKQVNVTAIADFAAMFDVYFGEAGNDEAVAANIGETASFIYQEPGTYTIRVVAKGAAIETTEYKQEFVVTAIVQPIASAPTPRSRQETDVISIFSGAYTNVDGVDYFPDWGQGGQGSSWGTFELDGDAMLQYINLSYQGIQLANPVDVSTMEYLHLDVWTADVAKLETSLISLTNGEKPIVTELTADEWTSIDIPISAFTDQGLTVADIHQLKFVGDPWAAGTVFIDNIYFYKAPSNTSSLMIQNFEGAVPTFTVFGNIADTQVIANPDPTGSNTTANVAQLTKTAGSEVWAGTFFEVSPLDLITYNKISIKSWSPKVRAVIKVKLENADASITHEMDLNTTVANTWEELTYDFSDAPAADYVRVVVFYDFRNAGDGSVYYYDEIKLVNEGGVQNFGFQNFEGAVPAFTVFGNIADIQVIANPDASGLNTTNNVAQLTKTTGSEVWAGSFFEVTSLDLATYSKISVKTWSPKNGAVVKLKLENADASITHEMDLNTSVANAWEELIYDFSDAPAADYVKIVIFFDFGNAGDDSVYYYDEFALTN